MPTSLVLYSTKQKPLDTLVNLSRITLTLIGAAVWTLLYRAASTCSQHSK